MSSSDVALSLAEVQDAAAEAYEIYGELGRGARGSPVYLARERSPGARMVLLELLAVGGDATGGVEYALEFCGEVHAPGSVTGRICPSCGATDPRSGRFCARCRFNFSDAAGRQAPPRQELLKHVREQTGNTYDILGEIDHAQGRGVVYFARDRGTGALVALRLQYDEAAGDREQYSLDVTQSLDSLLAALPQTGEAGSATGEHKRTLVRRRRGVSRRPPQPNDFEVDAPPSESWGRERARRRSRRIPWAVAVMGLLFLAGAGVLAVVYWRRGQQPAVRQTMAILDTTIPSLPSVPAEMPISDEPPLPVDSAPADSAPADSAVTLRIRGVPSGAIVKLDTVRMDSLVASVPAGPHTLSVAAPGYRELVKEVEIPADTNLDLSADLAKLRAKPDPCLHPGEEYNAAQECYDESPRLRRGSTRVQLPPDFVGKPRSSTLWVRVSADGRTVEVEPYKRSMPAFEDLATTLAQMLEWQPATKNGKPVSGWVEVEVKPDLR